LQFNRALVYLLIVCFSTSFSISDSTNNLHIGALEAAIWMQ